MASIRVPDHRTIDTPPVRSMPIVPVLPALDYADFALQAAQLFLACAVVVLAGQRVAAYLRPRWPAAPPRPAAALAGRERGPDLLSPWAGDGRQSEADAKCHPE